MKLKFYAICGLAVSIGTFGCTTTGNQVGSTGAPAPSARVPSARATVRIDFVNPERFTSFRVNNRDFQHSSTIFIRDVTSALLPVMARRFPGHTLNLRYTNIDLASRRTSGPQGLSVVPTTARASLAFDYVLKNPSGRTIARGSRRLVESAPGSTTLDRSHPVQVESDLMQRWLRTLRVPQ